METPEERNVYLCLDYYQRPFALFHDELSRQGYRHQDPHPIRRRFWGLLSYRDYATIEARPLLFSYLRVVESEMRSLIEGASIGYWLHVYRRLFPGPTGADTHPMVIGHTRAVLEAAIQKYALATPCDRIGFSGDVTIEQVLGGLLLSSQFEDERRIVEGARQLVLTRFGPQELREFYNVERLAYELFRTTSLLRVTGKGAPLRVGDTEEAVRDLRSKELSLLISSYDSRHRGWESPLLSARAVVADLGADNEQEAEGFVLLPTYNMGSVPVERFQPFFAALDVEMVMEPGGAPNFAWLPFPLRKFREGHEPFAKAFLKKHRLSMDHVLLVAASLAARVMYRWHEDPPTLVRSLQRAYEGPYARRVHSG